MRNVPGQTYFVMNVDVPNVFVSAAKSRYARPPGLSNSAKRCITFG